MKRFFGMMPSKEVEIEKTFKVGIGSAVTVQAGPNGWAILYADSSSEYKDIESTTEENYSAAIEVLRSHFCDVKEIKSNRRVEEI